MPKKAQIDESHFDSMTEFKDYVRFLTDMYEKRAKQWRAPVSEAAARASFKAYQHVLSMMDKATIGEKRFEERQ
jgi:hypothetical protein